MREIQSRFCCKPIFFARISGLLGLDFLRVQVGACFYLAVFYLVHTIDAISIENFIISQL